MFLFSSLRQKNNSQSQSPRKCESDDKYCDKEDCVYTLGVHMLDDDDGTSWI